MERGVQDLNSSDLSVVLDRLDASGKAQIEAAGISLADCTLSYTADMCYTGQIHNLRVPIERDWSTDQLGEAFCDVYRAEFGNLSGNLPIRLISLQVTASAPLPNRGGAAAEPGSSSVATPQHKRDVYFENWEDTAIYTRDLLAFGMTLSGPAIVEQSDATTVIEPGMTASVDGFGNLIVEMVK